MLGLVQQQVVVGDAHRLAEAVHMQPLRPDPAPDRARRDAEDVGDRLDGEEAPGLGLARGGGVLGHGCVFRSVRRLGGLGCTERLGRRLAGEQGGQAQQCGMRRRPGFWRSDGNGIRSFSVRGGAGEK